MPRKKKTDDTSAPAIPAVSEAGGAADAAAPPPPPRTPQQFNLALRRKVRLFYDIQEMRLAAQGRLLKKSPNNPIELHPDDLAKLKGRVEELEGVEKSALKIVAEHLDEVPFYVDVIKADRKRWKGLGPTMSGVILSSFDIEREDTPSKAWAFAGLAPEPARRCSTCHNVVEGDQAPYKHPKPQGCKCVFAGKTVSEQDSYASGKAMKPVAGEKLKYNKWLRSKMCGVLGPVLLQVGSPYRRFYDNYKTRKESAGWGKNDGHRHAAAIRYMVKMLILDVWIEWRKFLGLPVRGSYQEEYLGHTHGNGNGVSGHAQPVPPPSEEDELRDAQIAAAVAEAGA